MKVIVSKKFLKGFIVDGNPLGEPKDIVVAHDLRRNLPADQRKENHWLLRF